MSEVLTALAAGRPVPTPRTDAPSPVALCDPDRLRSLLSSAGFTDVYLQALNDPCTSGRTPRTPSTTSPLNPRGTVHHDLEPETRTCALDNLRASLTDHHSSQGVLYDSAAWLIHARRKNGSP